MRSGTAGRPYHIINTNLVLTESDERTYRLRGGDSFILSPLLLRQQRDRLAADQEFMNNELTLPTAMAISGAAANPWTGSGGVGVTRNPLVAHAHGADEPAARLLAAEPERDIGRRGVVHEQLPRQPLQARPQGGARPQPERDSPVCLLSDGGHFENLGLYELIRRRLRLIVLCDGTADPDYAFTDLQNAVARIWADFGARIEFDKETTLSAFMPSIDAVYPRGASPVRNAPTPSPRSPTRTSSKGHLVYLTTALCKGLRLKLLGYKGANQDFPDQSTADQFFDEEQFEAYRELGYCDRRRLHPARHAKRRHPGAVNSNPKVPAGGGIGRRAWQDRTGCEADLVWPPCLAYARASVMTGVAATARPAARPRGR